MAISATVRQKIWATTCRVLSPFVPVLYGKGYGHAHTEKESGEDGVGESHHVFVHPSMHQPVGDVFQSGNVVDKEHEEHGECAEYVYRGNPLGC